MPVLEAPVENLQDRAVVPLRTGGVIGKIGHSAYTTHARIAELREKVLLKIEHGDVDGIVAIIREAMTSETSMRVPDQSERGFGYKVISDHKTRLEAARMLLALIGLPEQKGLTVNMGGPTAEQQQDMAARLDELRAIGVTFEQVVQDMAKKLGSQRAAEPIDVKP